MGRKKIEEKNGRRRTEEGVKEALFE